jgi:hypothetical protein
MAVTESRSSVYKGRTIPGTYELKGNSLKLAIGSARRGYQDRPAELGAGVGTTHTLFTFERDAKATKEEAATLLKQRKEAANAQPAPPFLPGEARSADLLRPVLERLDRLEKRLAEVEKAVAPRKPLAPAPERSRGVDGDPPGGAEPWRSPIGSWHTTSAQKSLVVSVRPEGQALVMFIERGQHSIDHVPWESSHGGLLLQGVPRIRLWPGRHDQELRAEIEPIPEASYDPNKGFLRRFFMRRVQERSLPQGWRSRPVPEGWKRETLDKAWDASAGKRPLEDGTPKP